MVRPLGISLLVVFAFGCSKAEVSYVGKWRITPPQLSDSATDLAKKGISALGGSTLELTADHKMVWNVVSGGLPVAFTGTWEKKDGKTFGTITDIQGRPIADVLGFIADPVQKSAIQDLAKPFEFSSAPDGKAQMQSSKSGSPVLKLEKA